MNNMKYCCDSLAHDYDLFMPKTAKNRPDNSTAEVSSEAPSKVIPLKRANKASSKADRKASHKKLFACMATVFIIGAVFCNIYLRAEISKVGNELNNIEVITEQLKSEQTRLSVELEKKTSVGNLEKQASRLGMQKQEKTQMNYIFNYEDGDIEESADAK